MGIYRSSLLKGRCTTWRIRSGQGLGESGQEIEMTAMRTLKQDFEALVGATERLDSTMLTHADTFHDARNILKTLMPIM